LRTNNFWRIGVIVAGWSVSLWEKMHKKLVKNKIS
jgi:hypothetical protein